MNFRDIRAGHRWYALATEESKLGREKPEERVDPKTGEVRTLPAFGLRKIAGDIREKGVEVFIGIEHFRIRDPETRKRDRVERPAFGVNLLVGFDFHGTDWAALARVDGARHFWPLHAELPVPLPDIAEVFGRQSMRDADLDDVLARLRMKAPAFVEGQSIAVPPGTRLIHDGEGVVLWSTAEKVMTHITRLGGQPVSMRAEFRAGEIEAA